MDDQASEADAKFRELREPFRRDSGTPIDPPSAAPDDAPPAIPEIPSNEYGAHGGTPRVGHSVRLIHERFLPAEPTGVVVGYNHATGIVRFVEDYDGGEGEYPACHFVRWDPDEPTRAYRSTPLSDPRARPDLYAICHQLVGRDTAAELSDAIEKALGWAEPSIAYNAVAAALAAYSDARGEHWDADNGGRYTLRDLVCDARRVEAQFPA